MALLLKGLFSLRGGSWSFSKNEKEASGIHNPGTLTLPCLLPGFLTPTCVCLLTNHQ